MIGGMEEPIGGDLPLTPAELEEITKNMGLLPKEVTDVWLNYQDFDQDKSGLLEVNEVRQLLRSMGDDSTDEEFTNLIKMIDKDHSNSIDFKELLFVFANSKGQRGDALDTMMEKLSEETGGRMGKERRSTEDQVKEDGMSSSAVLRYLDLEISQAESCRQMPQAIWFFLIFCLVATLHERSYIVNTLERSIEFDLKENANFAFGGTAMYDNGRMGHKSLWDINSVGDFWSWLNLGFVPLLFREEWDVSEVRTNVLARCGSLADRFADWGFDTRSMNSSQVNSSQAAGPCPEPKPQALSAKDQGMYLYYNRVIGGVRLSQERAQGEDCGDSGVKPSVYGLPCYPGPYFLEPELMERLSTYPSLVDHPDGKTQWLYIPASQKQIKDHLRKMEDARWVDAATQKVDISFVTYNAIDGVLTITHIFLFFSRGGHFWKQTLCLSIHADMFNGGWVAYLAYAVWGLMVFKDWLSESIEIYKHVANGGMKGLRSYFRETSNVVDWLTCLYGIGLIAVLCMEGARTASLVDDLSDIDNSVSGGWHDKTRLRDFIEKFHSLSVFSRQVRMALFLYPFIISMKLFKVFSAQPRLGLVTSTLTSAFVDIAHFGVVFLTIFFTYAAGGLALFGREMSEFATYSRSINTCMRCILGDFDWEAMKVVGRLETGIWFWSFNVLILHVMFNMLLSIVLDTYMQVKANLGGNTETLLSQGREIFDRWRRQRKGLFINLPTVRTQLFPQYLSAEASPTADDLAPLSVNEAAGKVQGISEDQVVQIFRSAELLQVAASQPTMSMSDAIENIHIISDRLDQIHCSCCELVTLQTMIANRASHALKAPESAPELTKGSSLAADNNALGATTSVGADTFDEVSGELQRLTHEVARRFSVLSDTHADLHTTARSLGDRVARVERRLGSGPAARPLPPSSSSVCDRERQVSSSERGKSGV